MLLTLKMIEKIKWLMHAQSRLHIANAIRVGMSQTIDLGPLFCLTIGENHREHPLTALVVVLWRAILAQRLIPGGPKPLTTREFVVVMRCVADFDDFHAIFPVSDKMHVQWGHVINKNEERFANARDVFRGDDFFECGLEKHLHALMQGVCESVAVYSIRCKIKRASEARRR